MRRSLAVVCLILGVGSILSGLVNTSAGAMPPERLVAALVGGVMMIGLAWWLDRSPRT